MLGNVVSSGVKIMVLAVISAIASVLFAQFSTSYGSDVPTIGQSVSVVLASLAIVGLSIFGGSIANGLISGAPQLGAGAAVGTGMAVGAMGAAAAAGVGAVASGGAAALGATAAAARGGAAIAGAATSAYSAGAAGASGGAGSMAAGIGGMGRAVGAKCRECRQRGGLACRFIPQGKLCRRWTLGRARDGRWRGVDETGGQRAVSIRWAVVLPEKGMAPRVAALPVRVRLVEMVAVPANRPAGRRR
ncbi:type IV secretion system protein [Komagataeibacter rhaeticus]